MGEGANRVADLRVRVVAVDSSSNGISFTERSLPQANRGIYTMQRVGGSLEGEPPYLESGRRTLFLP